MNQFQEIKQQLNSTLDQLQQAKLIKSQLQRAETTEQELKKELTTLEQQLIKEEKDVDRLKSITLTNLWHSILKDKEEQISKEEGEALEVKRKLEGLNYELNEIQKRITHLKSQVGNISKLEQQYRDLMDTKKILIESEAPDQWQLIKKQQDKIREIILVEKEFKEAIYEGNRVLNIINDIKDSLNSAKNWGTYDIIGGGMIASMVKRDHMKQAQYKMQLLQHTLKSFNKELVDVDSNIELNLGIEDFLGFADWFFDGFFVDIAVQNRIKEAQSKIDLLKSKINETISSLEFEWDELKNEKDDLESANNRIIESL